VATTACRIDNMLSSRPASFASLQCPLLLLDGADKSFLSFSQVPIELVMGALWLRKLDELESGTVVSRLGLR
jgi:hypothetical protein